MSSANTIDTLNGLFKQIYADKIENLIPDGVKALPRIPFASKSEVLGSYYNQPVILGLEHGVTFAGAGEDAFALNSAVAGQMENAQVRGTQLVLRSVMGYAAASRSAAGGAKAFMDATKFLVQNMLRSISKKLEIELFYGEMGYGVVSAVSGNRLTIATAEWAPGIWAGAEKMPIEIRDATGATIRGEAKVTQVDFDNKYVYVDVMPAGVVATDVIWHKGAYGKEFAGIHKIISNTGSLFGINASNYSLWKGNTYSAGSAALSFSKIQSAIAKAMEKGLDGDAVMFVNPRTWANLLTEQAALRMYDNSYKASEIENGAKTIKFHSQNGLIEIIPSIFVKEGYAYILAIDCFERIGSTDVTFKRPGKGDEFFRELENSAGYELRAYTDQALFCHAPGHNVLITNIVNS